MERSFPPSSEKHALSVQPQTGLRSGLRELYASLSPARRRQLYFVLALMLAGAVAELAALGAVLPFLSLLADPGRIERIPWLASVFDALVSATGTSRLVIAAGLFIVLAIVAGIVRLQLAWSSQSFIFSVGHDLAMNIQRRILYQPYTFHTNHNTSTLVASLEKVATLAYYVLLQLMQAAIAAVVSLFIIAALIYIDPFTALVSAIAFTVIYLAVSAFSKSRLDRSSDVIGATWDDRVKIVQESLGGIRDVIIDSSQSVYLDAFRKADERFSTAKRDTAFIAAAPRFIIEAFGMALIATLAIVLASRQGGLAVALPVLGAIALGAQRLLPLLQQIYVSWSIAVGSQSLLEQVLELLRLPLDPAMSRPVDPLPFNDRIRFADVSYVYQSRRGSAVDAATFEIRRGQRIALIGKTGSGKSTLADLLMGLLEPSAGAITIDGVRLTQENRRNWQRSIAHVPQAIFLADASIARNIALGSATDPFDLERVKEAARKAELDAFVEGLPEGYDTFVGERGIRLSGGQRQRLGIARAIYKQAPVLVLDEATSALDDATEAAVMKSLDQLGDEGLTIIMIAHRLSTVSRADVVIRLDDGRVVDVGSYSEVLGCTPRRLARRTSEP